MENPILAILADAAARGVQVTIITNGGEVPKLTLKWEHKVTNCYAKSTFRGAGYLLTVFDFDGDYSEWSLRRGKDEIASGGTHECGQFYHFDRCLLAAEAALRAEVKRRKAEIWERRS